MTWDYCFSLVSTNNATNFDCNILGRDLLLLIDSSCSFFINIFFFFFGVNIVLALFQPLVRVMK